MSQLEVLYEDNHLIIINKPAGRLVQADETNDTPISEDVKDYIKEKYEKPGNVFIGTVHRIDRPVSGIVVFAKTSKALERMTALFRDKKIAKTYWAVVQNMPPSNSGTLKQFIKKNSEKHRSKIFTKEVEGSKYCELSYEVIGSSDKYHLLKVMPVTGRYHQIRAQLSFLGCPIKGDLKYFSPRSNADASIHLHARSISFIHPIKNIPLEITAPTPAHDALWQYFEANYTV